jgi:hypothetical protein
VHGLALGPLEDAVELEGDVGERLADAIVQFAGNTRALLGRADRSQAGSIRPSTSRASRVPR